MIVLVVVVAVIAPLAEGVLFRGYIFRTLLNWRGVWSAATTTGVLLVRRSEGTP